ncbi:Aminotransferase-like, plant mobile domain [Sesbania bispinosa]|nr:Aminotransferase-like, plant mobile domain [Sesbania bispinosa]
MERSLIAHSEPLFDDSSSPDVDMEEPGSEMIPRAISFASWTQLPPAREIPIDSSTRKWMTERPPPVRHFQSAPSSREKLFRDILGMISVRVEEALVFYEVPDSPSHRVGHSLLRSRFLSEDFPWSTIHFMTRATSTGRWSEWIDHIFANDAPFVGILNKIGVVDAIHMSLRLGTIRRTEDLEYLVQRWSHTTHTFYTSWGEFALSLEDVHVLTKLLLYGDCDISSSQIGCHLIDMAKELKMATLESAKYNRGFLAKRHSEPNSDFDVKKVFHPEPPISQPLKRATFLAFWLSKYVFHGSPWESRFLEYAPVRTVPEPPAEGEIRSLETRAWGWSMGRPRQPLIQLIDESLTGFMVTYTVSAAGGAFWPFAYRSDRVCLQFGLDQMPCCMDLPFLAVSESMKGVLFGNNGTLLEFDSSKFVPPNQSRRVMDTWLSYYSWLNGTEECPPKKWKSPSGCDSKGDRLKVARSACVSTPPSRVVTQGSSVGKGVEDDEGESFVSNHPSTPSCDNKLKGCLGGGELPNGDTDEPSLNVGKVLSTEVIPIFSSLLLEKDARVLSDFSIRHAGFLLPDGVNPTTLLKPVYSLFAEFLRFVRSHSVVELLGTFKDKVMSDLKALSLFGFKGDWFEELSHCINRHIPSATLEDSEKIKEVVVAQEKYNVDLRVQLERIQLELSQGEMEVERLKAKWKTIEEARSGLNAPFNL